MGIDLRILPKYSENADFAHDVIELDRDYEFFDIIQNLEKTNGREVGRNGITSWVGDGEAYGKTHETPYGDAIKGVQAKKLKKAISTYKVDSWRNKAFIAWLGEVPDELEIYLYWH